MYMTQLQLFYIACSTFLIYQNIYEPILNWVYRKEDDQLAWRNCWTYKRPGNMFTEGVAISKN